MVDAEQRLDNVALVGAVQPGDGSGSGSTPARRAERKPRPSNGRGAYHAARIGGELSRGTHPVPRSPRRASPVAGRRVPPDEGSGRGVRLSDVTGRAWPLPDYPVNAPCRPPTESSWRPRHGRVSPRSPSTTCPPSRSTPGTSTPARTVASHRQPADPAPARTSFGLVVITPSSYDPNVRHDLDDEAEMYQLNVEYWPTAISVH